MIIPELAPPLLPENLSFVSASGKGGGGTVLRVKDITGKELALKLIPEKWSGSELSSVTALRDLPYHPNLTQIFQTGKLPEHGFYYTMELAGNAGTAEHYIPDTLAYRIANRSLSLPEILKILLQIADAVAHLHDHNLFHGDIKPENIIFINNIPKLADFGTLSGEFHGGTPGFVPDNPQNNCDRDLYALCKTLYCSWSKLDVSQFPSLPEIRNHRELSAVRKIYLKGCSADYSKRFKSIREFTGTLSDTRKKLLSPDRKIFIRILIAASIVLLPAIITFLLVILCTPAKNPDRKAQLPAENKRQKEQEQKQREQEQKQRERQILLQEQRDLLIEQDRLQQEYLQLLQKWQEQQRNQQAEIKSEIEHSGKLLKK